MGVHLSARGVLMNLGTWGVVIILLVLDLLKRHVRHYRVAPRRVRLYVASDRSVLSRCLCMRDL